jgi:hypothetical protein
MRTEPGRPAPRHPRAVRPRPNQPAGDRPWPAVGQPPALLPSRLARSTPASWSGARPLRRRPDREAAPDRLPPVAAGRDPRPVGPPGLDQLDRPEGLTPATQFAGRSQTALREHRPLAPGQVGRGGQSLGCRPLVGRLQEIARHHQSTDRPLRRVGPGDLCPGDKCPPSGDQGGRVGGEQAYGVETG